MQGTIVSSSNGALVDRLVQLREAHRVLAMELRSTRRRLHQRERELGELRVALSEYKKIRATSTI